MTTDSSSNPVLEHNQLAKLNANIHALGILASGLVALIFFLWSYDVSNHRAILLCFVLSVALQLTVWSFNRIWADFSKSLLATIFIFAVLSFLPLAHYFLCALALLLVSWYLQKIFLEKSINWVPVVCMGVLFALAIFVSTHRQIGDAFIGEKLRQFAMNYDTLFHSSMSTMIKNYSSISTGLHGLERVYYHFLSHVFYAGAAKLTDIQPYEVYGYGNFIIFAPLLITSWLSAMSAGHSTIKNHFWWVSLLLMCGALSQTFNYNWNSYFVSESYMLGLTLLAGFMFLVIRLINSKNITISNFIVLFSYLLLITLAKVSIGLIAFIATIIIIVLHKGISRTQQFLALSIGGSLTYWGYTLVRIRAIKDLEPNFSWGYFQTGYTSEKYFIHFLYTQFPYLFLLAPLFIIYKRRHQLTYERFILLLILLAASGIGFAGLNLTIVSAGYYFSNVHNFIAMPILALLLTANDSPVSKILVELNERQFKIRVIVLYLSVFLLLLVFKSTYSVVGLAIVLALLLLPQSPLKSFLKKPQAANVYFAGVMLFFVLSGLNFFFKLVPKQLKRLGRVKATILSHGDFQNPYVQLFEIVAKDTSKNMMVYIPKTESSFWMNPGSMPNSVTSCSKMPFYLPIMTGKPAVFGLPDPNQNCDLFHHGYEVYTESQYAESARAVYETDEVCAKVKSLNFNGFYKITLDSGVERFDCLN